VECHRDKGSYSRRRDGGKATVPEFAKGRRFTLKLVCSPLERNAPPLGLRPALSLRFTFLPPSGYPYSFNALFTPKRTLILRLLTQRADLEHCIDIAR